MSKIQNTKLESPPEVKSVQAGETLINLATVKEKTGFCASWIYGEMAARRFPMPLKIGPKASRWVLSEIEQWVAEHIANRNHSKVAR